jgi:hypothetical protein
VGFYRSSLSGNQAQTFRPQIVWGIGRSSNERAAIAQVEYERRTLNAERPTPNFEWHAVRAALAIRARAVTTGTS